MAENVTTILDKDEILASSVNDNDVLYLVHGTGSDRDRYIKVSEIKKVVSVLGDVHFSSIEMHKAGQGSQTADVDFDGEKLKMSSSTAETTDSGVLEVTRTKLEYTSVPNGGGLNSASVEPSGFTVSFTDSSDNVFKSEVEYDHVLTPLLKSAEIQGTVATGTNTRKIVVDSTLEVGKANSNLGGNLVVNGESTFNRRTSLNRIKLQSWLELNADIDMSDYDTSENPPQLGDIVAGRNAGSSAVKVYIGYDSQSNKMYVQIGVDCAVMFMCTGTYVMNDQTFHSWTPLCNTTVTHGTTW